MSLRHLIAVGVLMEAAYLMFYSAVDGPEEVLLFIAVNGVAFILLAVVWWKMRRSSSDPRVVPWVLGFAVLFRLTLVPHPPVCSDDIYRYVWDGKVAASGINPFLYAPADERLAHLRTEELPANINFPEMRTIYPPLAQALFLSSHVLFGDSVTGLKFLLVLADLVTIAILFTLFRAGVQALLVYAWSPLPIMYFGLDGHIDALGIPFLLLCLFFLGRSKHGQSALALGLAGLAKLYPLFLAPLALRLRNGRSIAVALVPFAMFTVGCWLYWEPTGGLVESFTVFASTFEFNGSVFHLIYLLVSTNEQAHLISSVLFAGWLAFVFFLDRSFLEKAFLAFLGFVITAPVVQPWYLSWLAALLVLRWSPAVFLLLALSNVSNVVAYEYRRDGVWEDDALLLVLEYLPFYILLVRECVRGGFRPVPVMGAEA